MNKKKKRYPAKATLNLVIKDLPKNYHRNILIGVLIGLLVFVCFSKFAVVDRLMEANAIDSKAAAERARYDQLVADNAALPEVRAEYEKYFTDIESPYYADFLDVLNLIQQSLMSNAGVKAYAYSDNTIRVQLTGIDLNQASRIVSVLYAEELVESVSMSSADTTTDEYSSFNISILLVTPQAELPTETDGTEAEEAS